MYAAAITLSFIAKINVASATAIIMSVPVRRCLHLVKEKGGEIETVLWWPTELCISPQSVPKLAERAQASREGAPKPESAERRTSAGLGRRGRCYGRAGQLCAHKGQSNQEHGEKNSAGKKSMISRQRSSHSAAVTISRSLTTSNKHLSDSHGQRSGVSAVTVFPISTVGTRRSIR